jgi:hypothetical protein
MARRKEKPAAPAPDRTLLDFSTTFFTLLGAQVTAGQTPDRPTLEVDLPPALVEHFSGAHLSLYFQGAHAAEPRLGQELVAHGSRVFDRMLALLEGRSAFTLLRLPQHVSGGEQLLAALKPLNATIRDLHVQEQSQWLFVFHWRLTYRADDKRQELYTVVVDEQGARVPLLGEAPAGADAAANATTATAPLVDLAQLLADGAPPPPEYNEEGHLLPPKLPPVTHLARLAESARRYAIYHADLRCVGHEAEILPRLHTALNRLTTYYQQQIEEIYDSHDPDGEKRRALEADLSRKIAEEVENHRLHVQVELVGYVAVERPAAVLEMTLTDGKASAPVRIVQDRYSGALQRPACQACGAALTAAAVDQSGHLICDNCIEQCHTCQEIVCRRCGVEQCPVCGEGNCTRCGHTCWACGGRACAEHISRCPTCGDEVCHACQVECAACGVRQCRSHLYADSVLGPDGTVQLICPACAVRCPACAQYSVQMGVCSSSGQRFCRNCLVTCATCGRSVGPGFYEISPINRKPYCRDCRQECPTCGRSTPFKIACAVCGSEGCPLCRPRCSVCAKPLCSEHGQRLPACDHVLCAEHTGVCAIGGEAVCAACHPPCAICGRPHCTEHTKVCLLCHQEYCRECVRLNGRCDTCADVEKHGAPAQLAGKAWRVEPEISVLLPHYRWQELRNERYTIYWGEGSTFRAAVIVVQHTPGPERVIYTRRISMVERMRGLLGG